MKIVRDFFTFKADFFSFEADSYLFSQIVKPNPMLLASFPSTHRMSNHSGYKDIFSVQFAIEFQQEKAQSSCGFDSFGLCLKAQA